MTVSLQDIANQVNSFMSSANAEVKASKDSVNEIKALAKELSDRVEMSDAERKKMGEELTSKTTQSDAEYKAVFEKINGKINELTDLVDKARVDSLKAAFGDQARKEEKSAAYHAYIKTLRVRGDAGQLSDEEKSFVFPQYMKNIPDGRKALYASEATSGGFFASVEFIREVQEYQQLIDPMRGICRKQATSGESVKLPRLTDDTEAQWAIEQDSYQEGPDPKHGIQTIPVHEMRGMLRVSEQALEDIEFDLAGFCREQLATQFAKKEGASFLTGNANGKPRGIFNYTIKASSSYPGGSAGKNNVTDAIPYVPTGAPANLTADSIINVLMDLKSIYDANSTFGMTRHTLNSLRLLKDSDNRPLWVPFGMGSTPKVIFGRPVVELPSMDEIGANKYPIIVGDFMKYMIVDRLMITTRELRERYAEQGLIAFLARKRVGGDVLIPESFRVLKVANS